MRELQTEKRCFFFFPFYVLFSQITYGTETKFFILPPEVFSSFFPFLDVFLRVVRVGAVVFVIIFFQFLIKGAITHMTSRGKDDLITKGRHHMVRGALGTIVMMLLFFVTSVAI